MGQILSMHEQERLMVYTAGKLALERKERGLKFNLPEATALLTPYLLEGARDGETVTDLMESGRNVLSREDVMDGVPEMIAQIQVEAPSRTAPACHSDAADPMTRKLNPFAQLVSDNTDRDRAGHTTDDPGSDYDQTSSEASGRTQSSGTNSPSEPRRPGGGTRQAPRRETEEAWTMTPIRSSRRDLYAEGDVVINEGFEVTTIRVANTSDRPILIGSHFHFAEVNAALEFDRDAAWGKRLAVLSGGATCRVWQHLRPSLMPARHRRNFARSRAIWDGSCAAR